MNEQQCERDIAESANATVSPACSFIPHQYLYANGGGLEMPNPEPPWADRANASLERTPHFYYHSSPLWPNVPQLI